ncbi:FAD/NAD(P)-binding domain-containing protein [Apiospora aurea]|uniref:FAD/NAD(P)-binding domain-containing protein n=1 Tax=Apiospora aurea TaxID=335848 RepID=A0ABR1QGX0_9PEZI
MSATPYYPVLIIGAGISGPCLTQGLKKLRIPFKVFERDAETAVRAQGYRVRLHDGVEVIKSMAPSSVSALFSATTATLEHGMRKCNATTSEIWAMPAAGAPRGALPLLSRPGEGPGSPQVAASVDRRVLRDVLMTGIGDDVVFGKTYSHFEIHEDRGCVMAYFTNGSSERGKLLVGADGKGSAVRRQHVPDHVILDTGHGGFFGKTPLTAELRDIFERNTDLKGLVLVSDTQTLATPLYLLMEEMVWSPASRRNATTVQLPQDYIYWALLSQRASMPFSEEELAGRVRWGDAAV